VEYNYSQIVLLEPEKNYSISVSWLRSSSLLKWEKVIPSFFGLIVGIQLGDCWTLMDTTLCMTLVVIWMLVFPRFLLMGAGFGLPLNLISLWRFRAGCLMLLLGKETFWYGRLLEGSTLVLKLGIVLGLSLQKLHGVMWSGFPWQSLNMRFSYGLFSRVLSLPRRECVVGVMRATLYADSVMGGKSL
jgi:hypothetical protein